MGPFFLLKIIVLTITVTIVHKFKRLHSCKLYYSLTFTVVSFVHFCTSVFQALRRRYGDTSLQAEGAVRFLQDMIPTVSLINKEPHVYLLPLFEQRTQIQYTAQEKVYLYVNHVSMACLKENLYSSLLSLNGIALVYRVKIVIFISCHKALSLSDV